MHPPANPHHQVLINKFSRVGLVEVYAAHLAFDQVHLDQLFGDKEGMNQRLLGQVQLGMRSA